MIGDVLAVFAVLAMFGVFAAVVVPLGLYMCGLTDRNYAALWIGELWEKWQRRDRHRESRSAGYARELRKTRATRVATRARFRLPRRHVPHHPSPTPTEHFAAYTAWTTKMLEQQHSNRRSA
jgi:hypothetical protein